MAILSDARVEGNPTTLNVSAVRLTLPGSLPAAITALMKSPCTSRWLQAAIRSLAERDPLDAQRDAEVFCAVAQAYGELCASSLAAGTDAHRLIQSYSRGGAQ